MVVQASSNRFLMFTAVCGLTGLQVNVATCDIRDKYGVIA
jgi:hypothetical protein